MAVTPLPSSALAPRPGALVRSALDRTRHATGLPVLFGGALSPTHRTVRLTELNGVCTEALNGLAIHTGHGLGGQVLVTSRPGSVEDYATDAAISHEYDGPVRAEGLRAVAAVPVMVGEAVSGLLYGGTREPLPLGDRVLETMARIAARLGRELTVRAEVERRVTALETAALTRAAREALTGPEREQVREAHAELRSIAREVADPALRGRLQGVCDQLASPPARLAADNPLSGRETDVLALVAIGCTNAEAGRRLGLSAETVKSYLRSATRKLGTRTRTETVVSARSAGFLP